MNIRQLRYTMIENRMICPQMMSAIAKFYKRDKDLEHQSVMWITQHTDSESERQLRNLSAKF